METLVYWVGPTTAVFPKTVRAVWRDAFRQTEHLHAVSFNEGLERLEYSVFEEPNSPMSKSPVRVLHLPGSLGHLGNGVFWSFRNIRRIHIPAGLLILDYVGGAHLILREGLRELTGHPIYQYFNVSDIEFGENSQLKRICTGALRGTSIREFDAPDSLEEIGQLAFFGSRKLKNIHLNKNLKKIGDLAFWGTKVRAVSVPPKVLEPGAESDDVNSWPVVGCETRKEEIEDVTQELAPLEE